MSEYVIPEHKSDAHVIAEKYGIRPTPRPPVAAPDLSAEVREASNVLTALGVHEDVGSLATRIRALTQKLSPMPF